MFNIKNLAAKEIVDILNNHSEDIQRYKTAWIDDEVYEDILSRLKFQRRMLERENNAIGIYSLPHSPAFFIKKASDKESDLEKVGLANKKLKEKLDNL